MHSIDGSTLAPPRAGIPRGGLRRAAQRTLLPTLMLTAAACAGPIERASRVSLDREAARHGAQPAAADVALPEDPSLADYVRVAELQSPALQAAFLQWRATVEVAPQARSLPDPRITYGYFIREVETRVGPQRHRFGLQQTFPWPGKLDLKGEAAASRAEAARARFEQLRADLRSRVAAAYFELYYLAQAAQTVDDTIELLRRLERIARIRFRAQAGGHPDVIRTQVELGRLEDRRRELQELKGPLGARLNEELDRAPGAAIPWPKTLPERQLTASDDALLAALVEASPALAALEHEVTAGERMGDLARLGYVPDLTLGLDYIETGGAVGPLRGTQDDGKNPLVAMASFNVPIFVGRIEAGIREADARRGSAERTRRARERRMLSDLKLALFKVRDAGRKIELYEDTLVPKAIEALRASETAFASDAIPFLSVIDAQRILLDLQLAKERARTDRALSLATVERLIGRPLTSAEAPADPAEPTDSAETADPAEPDHPAERSTPKDPQPAEREE